VHLLLGPVGAGKSTFALRLAQEHAALRLTLDQWMVQLFSPDRPVEGVMEWYVERAARCVDRIWSLALAAAELGNDVVLEIGLLQRRERERFYRRVSDAGLELTIHVLDAAREVRRERVNERNLAQGATFSMVVPPAIFELASDLWEPLDESECQEREVVFLRTDGD
jgi:predicted kinase